MSDAITKILEVLNDAVARDHKAVDQILQQRVRCNDELADHPTIVVTEQQTVGTLGLLNGIIEPLTGKRVAASWDENWNLLGFFPYDPNPTATTNAQSSGSDAPAAD